MPSRSCSPRTTLASTANPRRHASRARIAPFALAAHLVFAGALTLSAHAQAQGASAAQGIPYDIPAGPLADAVSRFAQQSGVSIVMDADALRGLQSGGLHGRFGVDEGFERLLQGTHFMAEKTTAGYVLRALPTSAAVDQEGAVSLPATTVTANASSIAARINPPTTVGSKTPLAAREIPQSVSVITQDQMQQQNMQSVDDAMRAMPGVFGSLANPLETMYYSRGFQINTFQLDGVPTTLPGGGNAMIADNVAMYEQVEVLRGPAGLFNGFGGDGGAINLVRKRAPSSFEGSAELTGGTSSTARAMVDLGGPLNEAGTLRARAVAYEGYQHMMQTTSWLRNQQFYGTLEADVTDKTTLRVGASHTETSGKVMYGIPGYSNYALMDVPRSAYLGADWDHTSNIRNNAFVELEQKLNGGWTAKLAYNYVSIHTHLLNGVPGGPVDPDTLDGNPYSYNFESWNQQHAIDLYASGPFSLFGREHQLTIGANYLHGTTHNTQYFINPASGLDEWGDYFTNILTSGNLYSNQFDGGMQNDYRVQTQQYGVYGNLRFKLADALTFVLGGRVSWWQENLTPNANPYYNYFGEQASDKRVAGKVSPMAALVYDINKTYTAYASYTSIFKPQSGFYTYTGDLIAPVTGKQYEVGVKGTYLDGRFNTAFALFQIDEANRAITDPVHTTAYIAQGDARSRGFELSGNGRLLPGWTLSVSYAYTMAKALDKSTNIGSPFVANPRHIFKLMTDYQLPGAWHKWNVGGAAYVVSRTGYGSGDETYWAGGYATFDLHVGYQIAPKWKAMLSATNLLDRKYYQTVAGAAGNYYGDPLSVMLTLRTKF